MLFSPRLSAAWLIVGGALSGYFGVLFDTSGIVLVLTSVPMLALGVWQWSVAERRPFAFRLSGL
jgi:hypothetical protein